MLPTRKKKSYGYGFLKVNDPINLKNYIKKTLKDPNSQILINENEIGNYNNKIITIVYKKNLNLINE